MRHQQPRQRAWRVLAAAFALAAAGCSDPDPQARHTEPTVDNTAPRHNIVLIVTDDQTLESLDRMPYTSALPAVRFTNAFATTPLCCPSRASILTGQYSHHAKVDTNSDADELDDTATLATWLDAAGYRTGFIGKYFNGYPWDGLDPPPGWDEWAAIATTPPGYYNYDLNENGERRRYGSRPEDYSTDVLKRKALDFVASAGGGPFFLYFAPYAPHGPRIAAPRHLHAHAVTPVSEPPSFNEADVSDKPKWVRDLEPRDPDGMADERRRAWDTLLAVDEAVRAIVEAAPPDTVIVFTSDNGFAFGEHRWRGKLSPYDESVRVPLVVRYPNVAPRVEDALVANIDIAPTLAAVAGVTPNIPVDGTSLLPLLAAPDSAPRREALLLTLVADNGFDVPGWWAVRTRDHLYVELETAERELYDLRSDPHQLRNLAAHGQHDATRFELARRLRDLRDDE